MAPEVILHIDRRTWFHIFVTGVITYGLFAAVLYAQEPQTTMGLPITAPTSLLDRWLKPESVMMLIMLIVYLVDLRGDMRRVKEDMAGLKAFKETIYDKLEEKYVSRREYESRKEVDARYGEHQRFTKRDST